VKSDARSPTTDTSVARTSQDVAARSHPAEHGVTEDLVALAMSHPSRAVADALAVLAAQPTHRDASIAYQAKAIVERDRGQTAAALTSASHALRHARDCDDGRVADVLATMGATLVYAGRTTDALHRLQEAERVAPPEQRPGLLVRRADVSYVAGRYIEALDDLDLAIVASRRHRDSLWEARALNNRAVLHLAMGNVRQADVDAVKAEHLLDRLGQRMESAYAVHNQALIAHHRGRVADALRLIDVVTFRYGDIGVLPADLVIDHALILLTAGLTHEAQAITRQALDGRVWQPSKRAEILLTAARAAMAAGDLEAAGEAADAAGRLFTAQERPRWAHRAQLLTLQTRYLAEHLEHLPEVDPRPNEIPPSSASRRRRRLALLRGSADVVHRLSADGAPELAVALVLHGRIARDVGRDVDAVHSFARAATSRRAGSGLSRAAGWLAMALLADIQQDRRALLHACRRGLDAVDEHRALLGDLELRALSGHHGNELATMAFRSKVAEGDGRGMLWWIERWRATGLNAAPVRPTVDAALERDLAGLRTVTHRLETTPENDPLGSVLRREQSRRESAVRSAYRRQSSKGTLQYQFDLQRVIDTVGDRQLVELIQDQDLLYSIGVRNGRVWRRSVVSNHEALREAQFARFALRRAAFGRVTDLESVGRRLQSALFGPTSDLEGSKETIVVPPSPLLTAPWSLLPLLADGTFSVSPSATLWASASTRARTPGSIALVTGPGLSTGEAEVTTLSPLHDDAQAIAGEDATVAKALALLDGARLAHIAAHGTFRADAPLFSSLRLADGPLTVHDLERLDRPPQAMVLSACETGDAAPITANEALGLVTSLLAMGTSAVVASVVPVNDRATVEVMRHLHQVAGAGGSLASGMRAARQQAAGDPLLTATAAAFSVWGGQSG
jgi:tetratricopeptide (TPR) repeat protein